MEEQDFRKGLLELLSDDTYTPSEADLDHIVSEYSGREADAFKDLLSNDDYTLNDDDVEAIIGEYSTVEKKARSFQARLQWKKDSKN